MIVRLFRARARSGQEEAYDEFLRRRTAPFLRSQPGCLEVRVARGSPGGGEGQFLVLTVWDSLDHLKAAAGPAWDVPIIDPEESPFVESTEVAHFEEP
ncbi:MAG: antibiotic biosynthesis monooxygenase [Thermoplasmata archaeon]|nr:antibiotic biosynthesis monooxygenase [Thermoplasmata archaeon]